MGLNNFIQIGTTIKNFRIAKGLSQKEMAMKLGLERSTYSNYENNLREPREKIIREIADILGIEVEVLLQYKQIQKQESNNEKSVYTSNMRNDRLRNIKLVTQIQNEINSRIAETVHELLRNKDSSGKDEILSMVESINYKLEDNARFICEGDNI